MPLPNHDTTKLLFLRTFATAFLTVEYCYKAAVRHRSFDGWWRYRFEVSQVWHPAETIRWVEDSDAHS